MNTEAWRRELDEVARRFADAVSSASTDEERAQLSELLKDIRARQQELAQTDAELAASAARAESQRSPAASSSARQQLLQLPPPLAGAGMTMAQRADRYALYQEAVQAVDDDITFFEEQYARVNGADRQPMTLREDFCGTCQLSCEFVKRHAQRQAYGVDLDPEPLAYARAHNLQAERGGDRVHLVQADVRAADTPCVDMAISCNYSHNALKRRAELLAYFRNVRAHLNAGGLFFVECFGGPESHCVQDDEPREYDGFVYEWHQVAYNPATSEIMCEIHFVFPDGSALRPAFRYDWRMWTPAEIFDVMDEAGFERHTFFFGELDEDGCVGDGFVETMQPKQCDAWLAYCVGIAGSTGSA